MNENTVVLFICMGIFALLAYLIHASSRDQTSAAPSNYELRSTLDQILSLTRNIERALDQQRRVLNDAHKKICAVTKGPEKPAS